MEKSKKKQMKELKFLYYKLCQYLTENKEYIMMSSCNKDNTRYCVPKGTVQQVTYYGKPEKSIRISDHWSWYANLKRCREKDNIQCYNVDMSGPTERLDEGKASLPIEAAAIAVYNNNAYHTIAGAYIDCNTGEWKLKNSSFDELVSIMDSIIDDKVLITN